MVDLTALGLSERTIQEIEEAESQGTMDLIVNSFFKELESDGKVEWFTAFAYGLVVMQLFNFAIDHIFSNRYKVFPPQSKTAGGDGACPKSTNNDKSVSN